MTDHNKAPKILYLNNFPGLGLGGGERHLIALAQAAQQAGYDVTIACVSGGGLERVLKSTSINSRAINIRANFISAVLEIYKLCRKEKPDILHTTGFWTNNVGRFAGRLAGVPVILSTIHCEPDSTLRFRTGLVWRINQGLRDRLDRVTSRFARLLIAVSEQIKNKLVSGGIREKKVVVIHNAVSSDLTSRLAKNNLNEQLPSGKLIGCIGRLEPVKGIKYLLDACSILSNERDNFHLIIVGDGPQADELAKYSRKSGLADKVVFTGWLNIGDALGVLSQLDIYVLPSLSEGLNTTLLEALILERPVVATEVGGNPEVIINNETGVLVPPKKPKALAQAIAGLLDDQLLGDQLAANGRKLVLEKYDLDQMIGRTLEIYKELLAEGA